MSTICCPRCKGSGEGSAVYLGELAEAAPHCGMCDGTGQVPLRLCAMVKLKSLTEAQLRTLLGWDPDLSGVDDAHAILLTAARNRHIPEEIPVSMIPEAA